MKEGKGVSAVDTKLKHISGGGIYQSFFRSHPDAVYILDLEGNCIDANPACVKIFGYSHEELLHTSFNQIVVPEKLEHWKSNVVEKWIQDNSVTFETTIFHKDGHRVELDVTDTPIVTSGEIVGVFCIAKDITRQKNIEKALKERSERYESLKKYNPNGIVSCDLEWSIIRANPAFERITGYEISELRASNVFEMLNFDDNIQRSTSSKALLENVETSFKHKDGHRVDVRVSTVPIIIDGTNIGVYAILEDITAQKNTEKALKERSERYESLKKHNPHGICSLDLQWNIIRTNPVYEQITGYSTEELVGLNVFDVLSIQEERDTFVSDSFVENVEITIRHKGGRRVDVRVTTVPIIIDGEHIGAYVILEDITKQKRTQQQLLETQRLFKLISENSQDVILRATKDGTFTYLSPSIQPLLGYDPADLIGKPISSFFHVEDAQYMKDLGRRIMGGEDLPRFTRRLKCKDGNYLWFETTLKVIRDEQGHALEVVGVGRDVSEQMGLQESLEHVVNIAGLAHWEWDIVQGIVTYSNQGYRNLGVEGSTELFTYQQFTNFIHPEDVEFWEYRLKKSIEIGDPFESVFRIVRPDGSVRYLHSQGEVLLNETGVPIRMVGASQDITELKTLELQVMQGEERYGRLVENSLDAICIFEDRKWVFMNSVGLKMFGVNSLDEIIGQDYLDFLDSSHHTESLSRISFILAQNQVKPIEYKWRRKNGEQFYAEVLGSAFGKSAIQICLRDITERKRADELLMRSEKLNAVGQLAAGVAHEIRNPLTALKGFTQMLYESSRQPKKRLIEIMKSELDRIEKIVSEMLMLAKPQAIRFEQRQVEFILREVITLLSSQAVMRNVVIETEFDHEASMVLCEESQLKQVFVNIIKNAIEAMASGGNLFVRLKTVDHMLSIEFIDEGEGIPEERIPRLGEPFFTTKETGTGLGLMVSHKIIITHRGSMEISSEVGKGTTVRVKLPLES